LEFIFIIKQFKCKSSPPASQLGGTTFDIFALSHSSLTACNYFDMQNNTYIIACTVPHHLGSQLSQSPISNSFCINLNVILIYEHFDGYSESLHEWSAAYLPLRRKITDNQLYCANVLGADQNNHMSSEFLKGLNWYSGHWLSTTDMNVIKEVNWYHHLRSEILTAFQYKEETNTTTNYRYLSRFPLLSPTIPSVAANLTDSLFLSEKYIYHPFMISDSVNNNHSFQLKMLTLSDSTTSNGGNSTEKHFARNNLYQQKGMKYIFLGASHMRYNFDLLIQYFFNESYLKNVNRKHDHLIISDWRFDFVGNAKDLSQFLMHNVCNHFFLKDFEKKVDPVNFTIIIQTGAWDLSVAPLRNLIHNPIFGGGKELSDTLLKVINHNSCPGLHHLIWVTSVPYPQCYNPKEPDCGRHRNYRTNSAISAVNQYFIQSIFEQRAERPLVKLSIVDAYSIIKPRLVLNEDSEVICLSHYLCRIRSLLPRDNDEVIMLQSPAGAAVVQTIIHALGW